MATKARYAHTIFLNQDEENLLLKAVGKNYSITDIFRKGIATIIKEKSNGK